ncbi:MAG: chromosome partitioning protein ParA [Acutalibacteraceae bacterium]|nr:chromosome partitioning protein ParA [Acutalibacteraceae bacterium]
MKLKLAILEKDTSYLNRIVAAFSARYYEKLEIYSFTDSDVALSNLGPNRIDVLLANDFFDIDTSKIPVRCGFAYLVDSQGIDTVREQRAICKFQKADLIYKQILSIYSESAENVIGLKFDDDSCKIIAFASPSGGTGSSTLAAASAQRFAANGAKVLYLNLEHYGLTDVFFNGEGQFNISDVIFALKSRKSNLALKLESCVRQDRSGVCFYASSPVALDMIELSTEEILLLISELKLTGLYQYIILDMDFGIEKKYLDILHKVHSLVITSDGSQASNTKIRRAYEALNLLEQNSDFRVSDFTRIVYNRFKNGGSEIMNDIAINNIGGMPQYDNLTTEQLLAQLSAMAVLDKII